MTDAPVAVIDMLKEDHAVTLRWQQEALRELDDTTTRLQARITMLSERQADLEQAIKKLEASDG